VDWSEKTPDARGTAHSADRETSLQDDKRPTWLPKRYRRKFVLPSRRFGTRRPAEARRGGQGVLGRAVPMGLMAAGVVSGMIIAYFYPAFRELPHRLY
ncbi:hypothetical protein FOZ63_013227, partial [Perkinsus olseni]